MAISWCRASAVRFIGTQRPSCTIDHEVSTHSATAARERCSVSTISTSETSSVTVRPPVEAVRSTALRTVRDTSHGSVSPNATPPAGRLPAAPASAVSRSPRRDRNWPTISRSAVSPSRRNALGVNRSEPSAPARTGPAGAVPAPVRPAAAHRPRLVAELAGSASRSISSSRAPDRTGPAVRPARRVRRGPAGLRALAETERVLAAEAPPGVQSSPGRSARRFASSAETSLASRGSPNAWPIRPSNSARCASVIEFIMR